VAGTEESDGGLNAIFVGEKRSGKTTLAFHMALETNGGVIVFDPKKEFRDWPATVTDVAGLDKAIAEQHNVIIWRPVSQQDDEKADIGPSFDELATWVLQKHDLALAKGWDKEGKHFTLLVDEAYNVQSHAWINQKLLRILSQCRPEILNVFQTFQSVKNVNSDSRSRVSDWYLFTITLPTDLKRLEEFSQPEVIAEVQHLDEHQYVHFINEKGTISSTIHTEPEEWYEDLNYSALNESEEKTMAGRRGEWKPLQFDEEDDLWDWFAQNDRRKEENPDSEYKERKSDKQRSGGGRRESRRERGRESSGSYTVYRRKAS
jgi:hypothetical protein